MPAPPQLPRRAIQNDLADGNAVRRARRQALSRQDLLDRVWGEEWIGNPRTLDVHIRWLREKIEDDPAVPIYIETVRGHGYRFTDPAARGAPDADA